MSWVKEKFQSQPNLFAFPFTDDGVSAELINKITSQPNNICDLSFGTSGIQPVKIGNHFQRIPMEQNHIKGKHIVGGEILYYLAKNTIGYYKKL
jgi:hypothetical protein